MDRETVEVRRELRAGGRIVAATFSWPTPDVARRQTSSMPVPGDRRSRRWPGTTHTCRRYPVSSSSTRGLRTIECGLYRFLTELGRVVHADPLANSGDDRGIKGDVLRCDRPLASVRSWVAGWVHGCLQTSAGCSERGWMARAQVGVGSTVDRAHAMAVRGARPAVAEWSPESLQTRVRRTLRHTGEMAAGRSAALSRVVLAMAEGRSSTIGGSSGRPAGRALGFGSLAAYLFRGRIDLVRLEGWRRSSRQMAAMTNR